MNQVMDISLFFIIELGGFIIYVYFNHLLLPVFLLAQSVMFADTVNVRHIQF